LERSAASFDVLGAESMGQIGYVLAQAMQSVGCTAVPILTQVVVDQYSDAFKDPSKFVGPIYGSLEAQALAQSLGYVFDGWIQLFCVTWNISILQSSANLSFLMNLCLPIIFLFDLLFSNHISNRWTVKPDGEVCMIFYDV
jgi:hypothetical protein